MFGSVKNGWGLIVLSIRVFRHHPSFLLPLLGCWLVYAPLVLYVEYAFDWEDRALGETLLIVFGIILLFSWLLAMSCLVLLELIERVENGEDPGMLRATFDAFTKNLVRALPIILVWAAIWFALELIEALVRRKRESPDTELNAENAAKTLAGYGEFSLSGAFFDALNKGIRMVVFLILPGIAWREYGPLRATKMGLGVVKAHLGTFAAGFVLTELAAGLVFLPPAILFVLSSKFEVSFPTWVWAMTIVYCSLAWSFSLYLEQMFCAELYLWHLKWERRCKSARKRGEPLPSLDEIPRPSVLDEVCDLTLT